MVSLFYTPDSVNAVRLNDELRRIESLPRRTWTEEETEEMVEQLTQTFRTPYGQQRLFPIQAQALAEIGMHGGLLAPVAVGGGKSLISFLAPSVCEGGTRPLLLIPAKLQDKTRRDRATYGQHWKLSEDLRVITYEWLGRIQAAEVLEAFQPNLIIMDEAHRCANLRAAVTRRLLRYFKAHPTCQLVCMSGTITKRSLHNYAHLAKQALREFSPLPKTYSDLELWADALDERKGQLRRADPGALRVLCNPEESLIWEVDSRSAARMAYRRRLVETPGVVSTTEGSVDCSISISRISPPPSLAIEAAFEGLRRRAKTPDEWPLFDGLEIYRHARELALGLYYVWDPRPEKAWLDARKAWGAFARSVLSRSQSLDSELQVRKMFPDQPELLAWQKIQDTFKPNVKPVWLDDSVINLCAEWLEDTGGICWTEHVHFAERLSRITKLPYFSRGGLDAGGRSILARKSGGMICSIQSIGEGQNLQAWSENLVISPPPNGQQTEQYMGRTHRAGQEADEVCYYYAAFCAEHVGAFWQARRDAEYVQTSTGSPQKLLLADHDMPSADDMLSFDGWRWKK